MTAEVADIHCSRVVAAGFGIGNALGVHVKPNGAAGIVATNDLTTTAGSCGSGGGISEKNGIGIGSLSGAIVSIGRITVAGALEHLFDVVSFDNGQVHAAETAEQQYVTGSGNSVLASGVSIENFDGYVISSDIAGDGHIVLVDAGIHEFGQADLLEFAYAVGTAGAFTGGGESGQQHGGQNRDDGDYHRNSQLYQQPRVAWPGAPPKAAAVDIIGSPRSDIPCGKSRTHICAIGMGLAAPYPAEITVISTARK